MCDCAFICVRVWLPACMHVLDACSCTCILHVIFSWREFLLCIWYNQSAFLCVSSRVVFFLRISPCCYIPAVLEGALLHFTHRQQSRTQPPTRSPSAPSPQPPGSQQGHWAKASPALQPQRWARTPQGSREGPAGTWAVVSHRVGQRAGMLNAIWPCHSCSGNRLWREGRSRGWKWRKRGRLG